MDVDEEFGTILIGQTTPVSYFDQVIGNIEDIILSPEFQSLQDKFFETHWQSIENTEENKHHYMEIFQEYTETFEKFFIEELTRRMQTFDMKNFAYLLEKNEAFHDTANYSEVFELLHSFSDFQVFKELILDYRKKMEGIYKHLELDILITKPLTAAATTEDENHHDTSTPSNFFNSNISANEIDITDQFFN